MKDVFKVWEGKIVSNLFKTGNCASKSATISDECFVYKYIKVYIDKWGQKEVALLFLGLN